MNKVPKALKSSGHLVAKASPTSYAAAVKTGIEKQEQIHTFDAQHLYPNSILKPVGSVVSSEQLTPRSASGAKKANKQLNTSLSRMGSLNDDPKKAEIFLRDRSTFTFKKNINDRRDLLTRMAQKLTEENLTAPPEAKVSFNPSVLLRDTPPDPNTFKNVAQQAEEQAKYKRWKTVDDVSTYLADNLDNNNFSEETIFDLLNYCDDREVGASALASASLGKPAIFAKSADTSAIVCDPDAAFTEANLLYLKKNGLLEYTLQKTVEKIEDKQNSLSGTVVYAVKTIKDYIWTAFMSIVKLNEREPDDEDDEFSGGRRTRRNKRIKKSKKRKLGSRKKGKRSRRILARRRNPSRRISSRRNSSRKNFARKN